jgi:hypothetical protein
VEILPARKACCTFQKIAWGKTDKVEDVLKVATTRWMSSFSRSIRKLQDEAFNEGSPS